MAEITVLIRWHPSFMLEKEVTAWLVLNSLQSIQQALKKNEILPTCCHWQDLILVAMSTYLPH